MEGNNFGTRKGGIDDKQRNEEAVEQKRLHKSIGSSSISKKYQLLAEENSKSTYQ
jgi:hypothetical protein